MIESNIKNDSKPSRSQREKNKLYFENRKEIKNLIKNMNTCLENNSNTFFLALFYMDLIFENYSLEEIMFDFRIKFGILSDNIYKIDYYILLSLGCFVIASKYNEKDPHVPDLNSFLRIYNKCSKFYFIFSLNELMNSEVYILKILKYKLNYFNIYQFFTFFFANGILFEKNIQDSDIILKYKYSEKKILEKIYVKSREILDFIIDDYEEYHILFNGEQNYITAIEILIWSIENILNIQITNDHNYFFPLFYGIDMKYNKHIEIYSIIQKFTNTKENLNNNISNSVINDNYNFNYGNYFINSNMSIIKNYNKNLCLLSVSNSNHNFDNIYKIPDIKSDFKTKNSKSFYFLKNKKENSDYYGDINELNEFNSHKINTNIMNSNMPYNRYNQETNNLNQNKENKDINNMSEYLVPIISKKSKESKELKQKKKEKTQKRNELYRNLTNELTSNHFEDNEGSGRKFQEFPKNINISKNIFKSISNFNSLNESSKKSYENQNNYLNNINYITKKINKGMKTSNKRNINIEYNNSTKSTCYKSWLSNENSSPKDILNKTKKIFDVTNKRIIDFENKDIESSSLMVNSHLNKYIDENDLKDKNKDKINSNYNIKFNNLNNDLNNNLSGNNIIYKIKNDYLRNRINKFKEEKSKENTIIINNNIQINNYVEKENNNYSNYYNNSQQNISDIENINLENYINKKYFNINSNNKNIFLNSEIKNKKNNKDIVNKKKNLKKINFFDDNNEKIKENQNDNNNFNIVTKRNKDNIKINKDKNNRILNLGKFQTYFDYSSFGKNKGMDYSQRKFNLAKHIDYNNSSFIDRNAINGINYNNALLKEDFNYKSQKFNYNFNIYEENHKMNSEYYLE